MSAIRTTGRRAALASTISAALLLALAPAALAADGVGLYGRTTDKVIVYFAFGTMILFVALIVGLSILQARLDRRKEQRKQELERLGS